MTGFTLVREIRARPSIVFDLLATSEGLTAWWGPDQYPVHFADADVRAGGAFRVRFLSADGIEHECVGKFLEIEPPERIVMSWRWTLGGEPEELGNTSRVAFMLRAGGIGTELTLVHDELRTSASAESHRQGWIGALSKLSPRMDELIGLTSDAQRSPQSIDNQEGN